LYGTTKSPEQSLEKAIELTQKAIAPDDSYPYGHAFLGWWYCYKREYDKALAEGERALALNPSGADVYVYCGFILTCAGRPEEAIPLLKKAMRLNPFAPGWYNRYLGESYQVMGRFEEAVSAYKKALQLTPDNIFAHLGLAATWSMMGREKEARAEAGEVLRLYPKFSLDYWAKTIPFKDQSKNDGIINALRKAGVK